MTVQKQKKSVRRSDLVLIEDKCWRNVEFTLERKERLTEEIKLNTRKNTTKANTIMTI